MKIKSLFSCPSKPEKEKKSEKLKRHLRVFPSREKKLKIIATQSVSVRGKQEKIN